MKKKMNSQNRENEKRTRGEKPGLPRAAAGEEHLTVKVLTFGERSGGVLEAK
jgi:hypothetical protein